MSYLRSQEISLLRRSSISLKVMDSIVILNYKASITHSLLTRYRFSHQLLTDLNDAYLQ